MTSSALTPKEYAGQLGMQVPSILFWINSGQLRAINVSSKLGSKRPTWRISLAAIAEFEARRSARPPAKAARRKRKKQDDSFVVYF